MARISPLRLRDMRRPEHVDPDRWAKVLAELGGLILARFKSTTKTRKGIEISYEIDYVALERVDAAFEGEVETSTWFPVDSTGSWEPGDPDAWKQA